MRAVDAMRDGLASAFSEGSISGEQYDEGQRILDDIEEAGEQ